MENVRSFQGAHVVRSLLVALAGAFFVYAVSRSGAASLAFLAGSAIGVAYFFHIAGAFHRLVKGGQRYLPLSIVESMLRVIIAGAAPFVIFRHGPAIAYFTYLAGFVAPLAVAITTIAQRSRAKSATTGAR